MQAFLAPLAELAEYKEIFGRRMKDNGILQIAGCVNSQKTHLMYALGDGCFYKIIAFSSDEKAKKAYEEYRFLDKEAYLYPAKDLLFYHADIKGKYLAKQRMEVVRALIEAGETKESCEVSGAEKGITVITTVDAFLDGMPPLKEIKEKRVHIASDGAVDFTKLQEKLSAMGYELSLIHI